MCKKLNDFKENNGSLFLNVNLFFKYNTDRRKKKKDVVYIQWNSTQP